MAKNKKSIVFVLENDKINKKSITAELKNSTTYEFIYFTTSDECISQLQKYHPIAVFVDYDLNKVNINEQDGIRILDKIKELEHHTEVVFFSTHENTEVAVATIKHGAFDYIVVNDNKFYRLENELQQVEDFVFAKREGKKYKSLFYLSFGLFLAWIILCIVLVQMGIIKAGNADWIGV